MKQRETFASRLGFILVSAGCAIGLGNVWKFPYICGQYGGAAFIVIYLVFLAILGLPILVCEFTIGRASRGSMAVALDTLEKKGTRWHRLKWGCMAGSYLLMMFYTLVGGWMLCYMWKYVSGQIVGLDTVQIAGSFSDMLQSPAQMTGWMIAAVVISFGICALGLQNGVEKITKVMMMILIVIMIVLALHSLVLPGASEGVRFYLVPDFNNMKDHGIGNVVFAAMSHAFFTLSVGIGSMEIFGSYLNKERSLLSESINVVLLDTFVALTAGFIIIPACFAYGVQPDAGPSLLFITLPNVFNHMAGGRIWGCAFFIFMSFAALSTIIAVFESIISFYIDLGGWTRSQAVKFNIILIIILSIPAVLGYNVLSGIQPIGANSTIMDLEDFLVSYNLLPLGSLMSVLFCTHNNGWGWNSFITEANTGLGMKFPTWIRFYMTYILPLIIVVIYLKGYYDTFAGQGTAVLTGWMIFALLLVGIIIYTAFAKIRKGN